MSSIKKRPNGSWRARYRDDTGKEHARHFDRKVDAQRWLDEVTTSIVTGHYVDPRAGRVTFEAYAEDWRRSQPYKWKTADRVERELRLHAYPHIGSIAIAKIRPSTIQALIAGTELGPSAAGNLLDTVRHVFKAALRDRVVAHDPTDGVKAPRRPHVEAWIPDPAQIVALRGHLPGRFAAVVDLVAGTGMRAAEVFGLEVGGIDFLRGRAVRVERQLISGMPVHLATPKSRLSRRTIPVADPTLDSLAAHLAAFPVRDRDVLDGDTERARVSRPARLVFTTPPGGWVSSGAWGRYWRPAARAAGFPPGSGLHSLRHYYASALIRYGESVKVVQQRLGHSSPAITLQVYAHLWPDSDDRTRDAVAAALTELADSSRTHTP